MNAPTRENSSKTRLVIDDKRSAVEYHDAKDHLLWRLAVKHIVLMAEYTTPEGPWLEDYFLVFVAADGNALNIATASFYSDGRDEVLGALGEEWGTTIELSLFSSTKHTSRVAWPPQLVGCNYFESKEVEPQTFAGKLKRLAFGEVRDYFPSLAVRDFLMAHVATQVPPTDAPANP